VRWPWRRAHIAVVAMHGTIGGAVRPAEYLPLLERAEQARWVRALVVDLDSPGGSATASEELHRAVARVARRKPVVAYIRGLGASGGYYVACSAHRIVALPTALVGSIGAIYLRPTLYDLLARLGIGMDTFKSGPHKDLYGPWRPPAPEERPKLQGLVDAVFREFLERVAQGRRLPPERLQEVATGELFPARQALHLGLVDQLGDLEDALEWASREAQVPRRVVHLHPRRPWLARALGSALAEAVGGLEALAPLWWEARHRPPRL